MRIGIPNRSSFLHMGAVTQCVAAGILPWKEYYPAKLFYRLREHELLLCRCEDLCKCLERGELDMIFTGDDYAKEHLQSVRCERLPVEFLSVRFALLCLNRDQNQEFDHIFTKYPRAAKEYCSQWGVTYRKMSVVSGGCESFACCVPSSAAVDVICTGATQKENKLKAPFEGEELKCAWYARSQSFPETLIEVIENEELISRIRNHYQAILHSRDIIMKDTIGKFLHAIT